jgi:hypothetical protein
MRFAEIKNGIVTFVEREAATLARAAEADLAAARNLLAPEIEADAQHLAAIVKADGLQAIEAAVVAFQASNDPNAALKASLVALEAMKVDTTKLGADALQRAIAAAQTKLAAINQAAQAAAEQAQAQAQAQGNGAPAKALQQASQAASL